MSEREERVCFIVGFAECTAMFSTSNNISSVIVVKVVPLTYHHQNVSIPNQFLFMICLIHNYRNNERYFYVFLSSILCRCAYTA